MNKLVLDDLLQRALVEDIGFGDITSEAIFAENHRSQGFLLAKQELVLAGIEVFARVFALVDHEIRVRPYYTDGSLVPPGQQIASMEGSTRSLLAGERVALNFLQRMSGIATQTRRYVEAVNGLPAIIVDTRKTMPGLRMLEKYAVTAGGGKNHRYGLDSMVLIKDNHIQAAGGISTAVQRVRSQGACFRKIEVEVENLQQVQEALAVGVDIIMLDNMPIQMIEQAVKMIEGQALVEVSGNVVLERIPSLAAAGVDIISSGELTHSVRAADISMRLS